MWGGTGRERKRRNYHKHTIYEKNLVFIKGKRKKEETPSFETDCSISVSKILIVKRP